MNHTRTFIVALLGAALAAACSGTPSARPASSPSPATQPQAGETGSAQALPPGHPPISGGASAPGSTSARVSGTVALGPGLRSGASDVLYVIAKKDGSTLAVQRLEHPAFPLSFELSSADAMVSGVAFEGPVDVVARLSRTGDAIPSPGDLEGVTKGVGVPATGVEVTIDTTRR